MKRFITTFLSIVILFITNAVTKAQLTGLSVKGKRGLYKRGVEAVSASNNSAIKAMTTNLPDKKAVSQIKCSQLISFTVNLVPTS